MGLRNLYRRLTDKEPAGSDDGDVFDDYLDAALDRMSLIKQHPAPPPPEEDGPFAWGLYSAIGEAVRRKRPSTGINDPHNVRAFFAYCKSSGQLHNLSDMLDADDGSLDDAISAWLYS